MAHVIDLRQGEGKKKISRMMQVPASFKRPGVTPRPFFLWDNTAFVLGVSANEGKDCAARHAAFRDYHLHHLAQLTDPAPQALCAFLRSWTPEGFIAPTWPEDIKDQNVVFALEHERRQEVYFHDRPALGLSGRNLFVLRMKAKVLYASSPATLARLRASTLQ